MDSIQSTLVPLGIDNIDTDQIIPARFLKATDRKGFAKGLFFNWRYREDGSENPDFVLNQSRFQGEVLIGGNNFGCGSSREHAAWALADYGFKAVLSSQFADIFKGNALKNGILPIELPEEDIAAILNRAESQPGTEVTIDLEKQEVRVEALGYTAGFEIHPFHKHCLLNGLDETGFLIGLREEVRQFELQTQTIAI